MKTKTVRLDDQTLEVLMRSKIEGCNLTLPGQLPREDYLRVAKAIEAAGGKWNRKSGRHVFPHDVRETLNIGSESVEVVNVQQSFQAFNTPPGVASQMMVLADLTSGDKVLEPSAGTGNLVLAALAHGIFRDDITAVEIDPKKAAALKCKSVCADFLTCNGDLGKFDCVLMNPPFTGGQDVKHIKHALTFLEPGGRLVAICSGGPKAKAALEPLASHWEELPEGAFSESGTGVRTVLLMIEGNEAA
jgi:protein-L-isoaspartate O-methyltransferase